MGNVFIPKQNTWMQLWDNIPNPPADIQEVVSWDIYFLAASHKAEAAIRDIHVHECNGDTGNTVRGLVGCLNFLDDAQSRGEYRRVAKALVITHAVKHYFKDENPDILEVINGLYECCLFTQLSLTNESHYLRLRILSNLSYKEYLKTPEWQEKRKRKLEQTGYKCQLCSKTTNLEVHHNTYVRLRDEWDNDLTVLCAPCHRKHHDKFPPYKENDATP